MVIVIADAASSVSVTVGYNEQKVSGGTASVAYCSNIEDKSDPMKTFQQYENASVRTEKLSFHASINPAPGEKLDRDKMIEFVKEYMEGMGYGNQPYILYKHNDIDREHYHIVSVRVDKNGKKINDSFEGRRSAKLLRELAKKYGFSVGKSNDFRKSDAINVRRFDPTKPDYSGQIESLMKNVMKYHFTTVNQFEAAMRSLGVEMVLKSRCGRIEISFYGLDPATGKRCTGRIKEKNLDTPVYEQILLRSFDCGNSKCNDERQRTGKVVQFFFGNATSERHFQSLLAKFGISVEFSRNSEGRIFGATFIDHEQQCCFKASELKGITAADLDCADQRWQENDGEKGNAASAADNLAAIVMAAIGTERNRRRDDEVYMKQGRNSQGPKL